VRLPVVFLLAFLTALSSPPVLATTGNELKDICQIAARDNPQGTLELAKTMQCQGFVEAIVLLGRRLNEPHRFCTPDGVTVGQAISVLLKFLNKNPEQLHHGGELLAITAFEAAWPCK
jgi:hypothetical protein